MLTYTDTINLTGDMTLDTAQSIEDELRAIGEVLDQRTRAFRFAVTASDLWDLYETLDSLSQALGSYSVAFEPDKAKISGEPASLDHVLDEFAFRNEVMHRIGIPVREWLRKEVPGKQKGSALNAATQFGDALFHVIDEALKAGRRDG